MKKHITILAIIISSFAFSQTNNQSALTIEEIMKGEAFIGYSPINIFWSADSKTIYFDWNPNGEPIRSLYKYEITTQQTSKVSIAEEMQLTNSGDIDYTDDKLKKVFTKNGDVFLYDFAINKTIKLISTFNERESNVSFSADEKSIIFTKDNNIFQFGLTDSKIEQLTNFKSGSEATESSETKQNEWLEQQQQDLFEVLRDRKVRSELTEVHSDLLKPIKPLAIYLNGKSISNITLTEHYISYKLTSFPTNKRTMVPHFVDESGYTEDQTAYSKVGAKQASYELWIFDMDRDSTYQVDVSELSGIYNKPLYLKEYDDDFESTYEEPKAVNFFYIQNAPDNKHAVVQMRSIDNKDRWFARINFDTGLLSEINHQHDEAWIAGPGIPWFSAGDWGWLNNETIWYHSEVSGFSHLYKAKITGTKETALTKGNWEVHKAVLSLDKKSMYITTNQINSGERQLYQLNLKTQKTQKLTNLVGNNEVTISPDENYFAILQSFSNTPWELYLLKNESNAIEKQLTESTTSEFQKYSWRVPQNITFKASDGVDIAARLYTPDGGAKDKPVVVFVHGAGYLQNAHKWWSGYYREFMFHNFLADNGYVVMDIDYRASMGYGRDFRTGIYRHMGGKDLSDQVDGVNYLINTLGVDKDNIGIYGGSYGGFITLMAMFNEADTFKSGAGIRSVTDWAHYHHTYTSNILNTPVTDPTAYELSSPINFAEGLEGNLLILHGMVDDNVHFQDVVRLNQRLIELKKENWQMALYPLERHGFIEPSSWTDEYGRIYKLFEDTLK